MKKYIIPAVVVVVFGAYLLLTRQQSTYVASAPVVTSTTSDGTSDNTTVSSTGNPISTPTQPVSVSLYKDGTYKGIVANAYYGNLQLEAVIQGGKLVDCIPLVYPNDGGHTQQVSATNLPILKQEAIQSQSANVNIVSGATQTSEAYRQSLASALALAQN